MMVWNIIIEPYTGRYTEQLAMWTRLGFNRLGVPYRAIMGQPLHVGGVLRSGVVLDPSNRAFYSMSQMMNVVQLIDQGQIKTTDVLLLDDFMSPGFDGLAYALAARPRADRPQIYARLHAQSVDRHDFTYPMRAWMRPYELFEDSFLDGIFVASTELAHLLRVALFGAPIHVTGHIFDRDWVRLRVAEIKPLDQRSKQIVWSSRWDSEKAPGFFMDVIETSGLAEQGWTFLVLSGHPDFRSNDAELKERALKMQKAGLLQIRTGLSKDSYYQIVADSRLHFMSSLQDWVSYVLLEASALGTPTLAPCYRSFPEALNAQRRQLYVPRSMEDALEKMNALLASPPPANVISYSADFHHGGFERMAKVLLADKDADRPSRAFNAPCM